MNIRLYHPDSILENNTSLLSKEHTHYIVNVMRLKRGSNLNFFNKNGEWKSEIIFLGKDRVEVRFLEKIKEANNLSKTELAICLVKKIPMDNILQKATELGINRIIPIISERTEVKELNLDRAKKIVIEALWNIIYSDENADIYETNLMRRLSGLLYLDAKIVGDIKEKIKSNR